MGAIELRGIEKWFGDVQVIKGLDLAIHDGRFVVFVGPSGCGKSTLLRMIGGLEEISRGSLAIDGRDVTAIRRRNAACRWYSRAMRSIRTCRCATIWAFRSRPPERRKPRSKGRSTRPRAFSSSATTSTGDPRRCRAASGSAWPSAGRSCAIRPRSSSTSRCRTSTRR